MKLRPELKLFDDQLRNKYPGLLLVGVDEAGRGPLAGPVFAAAVILHHDTVLDCIYDSKALSDTQRQIAYRMIIDEASAFSVALATAEEIDSLNIRQASLLAMRRAVSMLGIGNILAIVDGRDNLGHNLNSQAIIKGDLRSLSIGAASILAKVTRDRYMIDLDTQYPGYGFAAHKGYPTKRHYAAIAVLGTCLEHRVSFRGVKG
jgi:ribonuclease HII